MSLARALMALALVALVALVSLVSLVSCGPSRATVAPSRPPSEHPLLGEAALSIEGAPPLDAGKVTVVVFWATWCKPCERSLPELQALREKHGGRVEVVGVALDDDAALVARYAKSHGLLFPIVLDPGKAIALRWQVASTPHVFVVDRQGIVEEVIDGDDSSIVGHAVERALHAR